MGAQSTAGPIVTYESEAEIQYDGLDLGYIERVAADVAAALAAGHPAEVAYMPGDATFYGLVLVPLRDVVAARPKDGSVERLAARGLSSGGEYVPGAVLVSWVDHGAYPFVLGPGEVISGSYVDDHLTRNACSGVSVAILLRAVGHFLGLLGWGGEGR